jgi:hypothetical protein
MMTRIAFVTLLATGLATGAAQAQAPFTAADSGNIVGGGRSATILGGGDNMVILYSEPGAGAGVGWGQAGRLARFVGPDGDGPQIGYLTPAPAGTGREAWMVGGGDDAQVVYSRPR